MFLQDKENCDSKGRDCIKRKSAQTFNCNTTCQGIYADVQWSDEWIEEEVLKKDVGVRSRDAGEKCNDERFKEMKMMYDELKNKMELMKGMIGCKGNKMEKEKYLEIISEYKIKKQIVQHFKITFAANLTAFGFNQNNFPIQCLNVRGGAPRVNPPAGADLLRHGNL